jgi:glucose 1-dehydrogenase
VTGWTSAGGRCWYASLLGAMTTAAAGFETYVCSRELPPSPRIDLVNSIGATYVSSQAATFADLADQAGNIDLIYEAAGHPQFALGALEVLGTNGVFILTGVPGPQPSAPADLARHMRDMVLRNQVLLDTVNVGPQAFVYALRDLGCFLDRWPGALLALIGDRHPPQEAPALIMEPAGIKTVISFGSCPP